jgi:heterogeneous nuclear ribonucleoprotein U-like protein 1
LKIDGKLPIIKDRNDGLMLRMNICLQKLIEIAAQRRRNYIIDHVNTTREIQTKRQRLFTGYYRIGVVIIPDDDELKKRIEKLENIENISIPSQWIKEAKAKFYFPQKNSSLEDVIYPELSYDDAKLLYEKIRRDYDQHRSSSRYDRHDDYHSSRSNNRNRYDDRDRRSRDRDRYARSRSHDRDRDRRTSREDSRFSSSSSSSSHRNENFRGGYSRGGGNRYSDHRQDSRNNQRGGFHEGGGNNYPGRGGGGGFNNQSNEEWRGGYHQQQRNEFGGGRGRSGFDNNNRNQYNNRNSYQDNPRTGGFRQDSNNQQRGRQFNDYDKNQQQQSGGRGFMPNNNNNNFNQQHDRQGFGSRVSIQ